MNCITCSHDDFAHNYWPNSDWPVGKCLADGCDCQSFIAISELCDKCGFKGQVFLFQPDPDDASCPEKYHCNNCIDEKLED